MVMAHCVPSQWAIPTNGSDAGKDPPAHTSFDDAPQMACVSSRWRGVASVSCGCSGNVSHIAPVQWKNSSSAVVNDDAQMSFVATPNTCEAPPTADRSSNVVPLKCRIALPANQTSDGPKPHTERKFSSGNPS